MVAAMATGEAHASSFVVLDAIDGPTSPSIVVLGERRAPEPEEAVEPAPAMVSAARRGIPATALRVPPAAGKPDSFAAPRSEQRVVSASIIAFGEAVAPNEKVAAIPRAGRSPSQHAPMPLVIRGGVAGDAAPAPQSVPSTPAPAEAGAQAAPQGPEAAEGDSVSRRKTMKRERARQEELDRMPAKPEPEPEEPSPLEFQG